MVRGTERVLGVGGGTRDLVFAVKHACSIVSKFSKMVVEENISIKSSYLRVVSSSPKKTNNSPQSLKI